MYTRTEIEKMKELRFIVLVCSFFVVTKGSIEGPTSTDCRCEKGEPGVAGLPGLDGMPGREGALGSSYGQKGDRGENGLTGLPGLSGQKGEMGLSGLPGQKGERYVYSNQGTGNEKLIEVIGEPGLPGGKGERGERGRRGKHKLHVVNNFQPETSQYAKMQVGAMILATDSDSNQQVWVKTTTEWKKLAWG